MLVTFADSISDSAKPAALAFRAAVDRAEWSGVEETSTSLTSTFLRYDPLAVSRDALTGNIDALLSERDWTEAPWPANRLRWAIPVVLGGADGPQFDQAAEAAGRTPEQAMEDIAQATVRVLTIGFAPGQGYLGTLPPNWTVPRQQNLTAQVPEGALVTAIRQLIIFTRPAPTGWLHIGQTAFRSYRPEADAPFPLSPGDEVRFSPVPSRELPRLWEDPKGGATAEPLQ